MCGRATFTIVVSSTCITVVAMTAIVISRRCLGLTARFQEGRILDTYQDAAR